MKASGSAWLDDLGSPSPILHLFRCIYTWGSKKYVPKKKHGVLEMFYFANICPSFCHLKSTNLRLTASSKMCEEVGSSNIHQQFEIMSFCIKEYGNETDLVETRKKTQTITTKIIKTKTNWIMIANILESCKSVYDVYNMSKKNTCSKLHPKPRHFVGRLPWDLKLYVSQGRLNA